MIKFSDFIKVEFPNETKVKFNMNAGDVRYRALDHLLDNEEEWINMNAHKKKQSNNNMGESKYLLSFAQYYPYGPEYFLFGGMYKVEKILPEVFEGKGYNLTLMDEFKEYAKRLIIKLEKPIGRDLYLRKYENLQEQLGPEIYELSPATKLGVFPGYNNVRLTHSDLQFIVGSEAPEWKHHLSSVKGVYCITDTSNGQLYIGSAYGDNDGIWGRWKNYGNVKNLTGGNKTFEEIKDNGADHIIDNFTYSIIEIFDMRTEDSHIIKREEYWKKVFQSVRFGMNNNATLKQK